MIKKQDFIWTVGYQGNTAIINRRMRASFTGLNAVQLLEAGMLRAAFCTAMWESDIEKKSGALESFVEAFSKHTGLSVNLIELQRMLGVYQVPSEELSIQQI